jgi:hypothetical protein
MHSVASPMVIGETKRVDAFMTVAPVSLTAYKDTSGVINGALLANGARRTH